MVSAKCSPLEDFDQLILNQFQTASKCPAPSLRKLFLYNSFSLLSKSQIQIQNTNCYSIIVYIRVEISEGVPLKPEIEAQQQIREIFSVLASLTRDIKIKTLRH